MIRNCKRKGGERSRHKSWPSWGGQGKERKRKGTYRNENLKPTLTKTLKSYTSLDLEKHIGGQEKGRKKEGKRLTRKPTAPKTPCLGDRDKKRSRHTLALKVLRGESKPSMLKCLKHDAETLQVRSGNITDAKGLQSKQLTATICWNDAEALKSTETFCKKGKEMKKMCYILMKHSAWEEERQERQHRQRKLSQHRLRGREHNGSKEPYVPSTAKLQERIGYRAYKRSHQPKRMTARQQKKGLWVFEGLLEAPGSTTWLRQVFFFSLPRPVAVRTLPTSIKENFKRRHIGLKNRESPSPEDKKEALMGL
eukprot:1144835-Pelagomonas_calceolata.AAC.3